MSDITYDEFLAIVQADRSPKTGYGRKYCNNLMKVRPNLARQLAADPVIDPFYSETVSEDTEAFVKNEWNQTLIPVTVQFRQLNASEKIQPSDFYTSVRIPEELYPLITGECSNAKAGDFPSRIFFRMVPFGMKIQNTP